MPSQVLVASSIVQRNMRHANSRFTSNTTWSELGSIMGYYGYILTLDVLSLIKSVLLKFRGMWVKRCGLGVHLFWRIGSTRFGKSTRRCCRGAGNGHHMRMSGRRRHFRSNTATISSSKTCGRRAMHRGALLHAGMHSIVLCHVSLIHLHLSLLHRHLVVKHELLLLLVMLLPLRSVLLPWRIVLRCTSAAVDKPSRIRMLQVAFLERSHGTGRSVCVRSDRQAWARIWLSPHWSSSSSRLVGLKTTTGYAGRTLLCQRIHIRRHMICLLLLQHFTCHDAQIN